MPPPASVPFADLPALATHLRQQLQNKKFILLYAHNGTGKTRLSMEFKNAGKKKVTVPRITSTDTTRTTSTGETRVVEIEQGDTLYFNAFTEDLFSWDNDLAHDRERVLKINHESRFFSGLAQLEMDNRIRPLLSRYADFDFRIDTDAWEVEFSRESPNPTYNPNAPLNESGENPTGERTIVHTGIKISRGEENIFIWCFFLAIVQLVLDRNQAYHWVKYVYIDDPISSLDEHNAIAVANHLAQLLKREDSQLKTIVSTHHTLFFNVLCNELTRANRYFLSKASPPNAFLLRETGDTPFFHHVAALADLYEADRNGQLFTHHFNVLRSILEKTASFHGYQNFSACIKRGDDDPDGVLHTRLINILSHGRYSLYEPQEMLEENKRYFRKILRDFISKYPFNPVLFPEAPNA